MEIWRNVKNFEGLYEVSNLGRVKSLDRYVKCMNGTRLVRGKILHPAIAKSGYPVVALYNGEKREILFIHRIVAFSFQDVCGEYFDGADVDHLDTNRTNNCATNLRWCTRAENINNPITKERMKYNVQMAIKAREGKPAWNKCKKMPNVTGANNSRSIPIKQIDMNGNIIKIWSNAREAAKHFGVVPSSIYNCLTKRSKIVAGFLWEYA